LGQAEVSRWGVGGEVLWAEPGGRGSGREDEGGDGDGGNGEGREGGVVDLGTRGGHVDRGSGEGSGEGLRMMDCLEDRWQVRR
jgi:hypothetical protein